MEIRARYLTVGLFTLGIIAAGFLFVYWLYNAGGLGRREAYRVRFQGSVSGLFSGSPVTFNGLRVGEVTATTIDPVSPGTVVVTVGIQPGTPVRADTKVALDFQGLAGAATVALKGGNADAQPLALTGTEPPMLIADADAGQSVTESARTVMQKLNVVLTENSDPLKATLINLKTFTDALSRNSDRVDGILSGLERMTGGANKKGPGLVIDLTAPRNFKPLDHPPAGQLAIPEPTAIGTLDTDKLILDPAAPPDTSPAQWADALPKLVQARLVQSFENAGLVGSVIRGSEGTAADYQLQTDIRSLRVVAAPAPAAEFEVAAKLLTDKGHILAGRIIKKSIALPSNDPKIAASSLNEVFGKATVELVDWATATLAALPPKVPDVTPAQ